MSSALNVHERPEVQAAMREAIDASRKRNPNECAAHCGTPMDPFLATQGWDRHPCCETGVKYASQAEVVLRANRRFYIAQGAYELDRRGNPKVTPHCPPGASSKLWQQPSEAAEKRARAQGSAHVGTTDRAEQMREALASLPRTGTRLREVYDVIARAGRRGVTLSELAEAVGRAQSLDQPRVAELVQLEHVVKAPQRRTTDAGARDVFVALVNVPEEHQARIAQQPTEGWRPA